MARNLKEIRNFNVGTVMNADSRETPDDAAVNSLNVDSNAPGGVLVGTKQDTYKTGDVQNSYFREKINALLKVAAANNSTSFQIDGGDKLNPGEYISMGAWAWKVTSVNASTGVVYVSTTAKEGFGVFTGAEIASGTQVYRLPLPKQMVSYIKNLKEEQENVIVLNQDGRVFGIEDFTSTNTGEVGAGINGTEHSDDFLNFPLVIPHDGDFSYRSWFWQ